MGFQNGAIGPAAQRFSPKDIKLGKEPALNSHHTLERTALEITQKHRLATKDHVQVKKKYCYRLIFFCYNNVIH